MDQRKEIFIKLNDCVGCLTCVLACAAEHSQAKDIFWAMLEKPNPIPRIWVEAADSKPVPLLGIIMVGDIKKAGLVAALIRKKTDLSEIKDRIWEANFSYAHFLKESSLDFKNYLRGVA